MTILAAAERKVEPVLAMADDDASAAIRAKLAPLVADGTGLVVSVCGSRVASFDAYIAARKECEPGGMVVFARAFKLQGGFEVRMGQVAPADPTTFVARYPSLLLAGEREIADKERAASFRAELEAASALAADPKTTANGARKLVELLRSRGREIFRTEAMRAAITAKDAAFVSAFKEIGKVKGKAKGSKVELASIAVRGERHAFADMDEDGTVRFGAAGWSVLFDTAALLPMSHAAYLTVLKPLLTLTAKNRPSEEVDSDEARAFGTLADDCQTGAVNAKNAEKALLECAFGQRTCDAAAIAGLEKALESSRPTAETAFVAFSRSTPPFPAPVRLDCTGHQADCSRFVVTSKSYCRLLVVTGPAETPTPLVTNITITRNGSFDVVGDVSATNSCVFNHASPSGLLVASFTPTSNPFAVSQTSAIPSASLSCNAHVT